MLEEGENKGGDGGEEINTASASFCRHHLEFISFFALEKRA
jgi:hypothetical protein